MLDCTISLTHVLGAARVGFDSQGDGDSRDKVDIAYVGIELVVVQSEFTEAEIDRGIGIGWIEYRGFDKGGSRIEEEGEFAINTEPESSSSYLRNGDGHRVSWRTEWNGTIFG